MPSHYEDQYAALLTDFVAGAAGSAHSLLVETHLALNRDARTAAMVLEQVGGVLLEDIEPAASVLKAPTVEREPLGAGPALVRGARAIVQTALSHPDTLRWRWRAPALRELPLPVEGASLIRLSEGGRVLEHDHVGDEWTLVLRGAFSDAQGIYHRGELGFASPGFGHAPQVEGAGDCICLSVSEGRWRFRNPLVDLAVRVLS